MHPEKHPKVSIITVNFNQAAVTCQLLDTLRKVSYPNIEVWVVDNGSTEPAAHIAQNYPEVHFIRSDKNLGFAGGNNLALTQATGDFLMLINNDTEVPQDFLQPLLATFAQFPDAGIVSPRLLFFYEDHLIQYAGTNAINPYTGRGATIGYKEKDNGQYNVVRRTDLAHGACMMFSREVLQKVGVLAEAYFLYYEEYDYCMRTLKAGYAIYYNGFSTVLHKESVSVGKVSPLKAYYMARNRILYVRKHVEGGAFWTAIALYYCIALPKNILVNLLKRQYAQALATIKGAFWHVNQRITL